MPARKSKGASEEAPASASKTRTPRPAKEAAAKVTKPKGTGKRGRPPMDPSERKSQPYVPTGKPRGRPPKDPSERKAVVKKAPTGKPRGRPVAKKRAAPAKGGPKRSRKSNAAEEEKTEDVAEDDDVDADLQVTLDKYADAENDEEIVGDI